MIEIKEKNSDMYIIISQRLDSMNADEAKETLTQALEHLKGKVIIDVSHLDYISSAGLQVILKCAKIAKAQQQECFLKGAHGTVREIFQVSGFLTFLKEIT